MPAHAFAAPAFEGGLDDPLDPQVRKHLGDVGKEKRVRRQDHHILRPQRFPESVEQVGDPVQGDRRLPASRRPLDQQVRAQRGADHDVLLRLDRGDDFPQPVRGYAAEHALQVGLLRNDPAVEQAGKLPSAHGEHPFQGQLALHAAVRRLIIHLSDLAGVIEVRHRGPPVHHDGIQRFGIEHAPAPQVPRLRAFSGRNEIQPREIGLARGHAQLAQPVQLRPEDLEGHLFLLVGVLLHLHVHVLTGFRAGQFLHLPDFPVDGVAGGLEPEILFLRGRMVR